MAEAICCLAGGRAFKEADSPALETVLIFRMAAPSWVEAVKKHPKIIPIIS
jgi:hypothetical protein